ncbi:MAG: CDP-diacylglycerol--glycerol-3-phosphate 3-phosphatidyltransferase [Phycisphaeraceae bacterium]|nr:CDP-diacylglycerol--glycerol-3-phosphate 3-phosphatidyltransferase [Phycisphaeraceae bacterium]
MMNAPELSLRQDAPDTDRRPLRARDGYVFLRSATMLAGAGVTPNAISGVGLAVGLLSGCALAATSWSEPVTVQRGLWAAAVLLILLRGACNILDGVVAVHYGQSSRVGLLYNEIPDRVSDAATLIGAGFAVGGAPMLGWVAALLAIFVAYVRVQVRMAGAPSDYCGPMAKPMRMTFIAAASGYMALTPAAWHWHWGPRDDWSIMSAALLVVVIGCIVTAWRRIGRAARRLRETEP